MMGVAVAPTEQARFRVLSPEACPELKILFNLTKDDSINHQIVQQRAAQPCMVMVTANKHRDALQMPP